MKALIVGASGATGKLLVLELLSRGVEVVAVVRPASSLLNSIASKSERWHSNYREVSASIADLSENELVSHLEGCDAVLSCLGHNLTFKGIFGKPRRLVADTIGKLSRAVASLKPGKRVKIILMNTSGNSNRDIPEKPPLSQRLVISLLRYLLPPHADNEQAADYLRIRIGQNDPFIDWVAVRPDSLTNDKEVSSYKIHISPTRNAIFDSAPTSRINVAKFMAALATESDLWTEWRGKMPVIYNDG